MEHAARSFGLYNERAVISGGCAANRHYCCSTFLHDRERLSTISVQEDKGFLLPRRQGAKTPFFTVSAGGVRGE
jgi:hypothetical protein